MHPMDQVALQTTLRNQFYSNIYPYYKISIRPILNAEWIIRVHDVGLDTKLNIRIR